MRQIYKIINTLSAGLLTLILILLAFQLTLNKFLISNCTLLFPAILFFVLLHNLSHSKKAEQFLKRHEHFILYLSLLLFLFVMMASSFCGYFDSGWDVGIVRDAVLATLDNKFELINSGYFSQYQNNVLIYVIYTCILRFASLLGFSSRIILCWFQDFLGVLCAYFIYKILKHNTDSLFISFFGLFLYLLLIGLSPWFYIPYSDSTGIFLPVLIIRLWQVVSTKPSTQKNYLLWFLIGFLSYFGFSIKPQIFIVTISIILVELIKKSSSKDKSILLLSLICGILSFRFLLTGAIYKTLPFSLDNEKRFSAAHYLMMGLNKQEYGIWNAEDVNYSNSFTTYEERVKGNLSEYLRRLNAFTTYELILHAKDKLLFTYEDGTFSWGEEGDFFHGPTLSPVYPISDWINSLIRPEGKYFKAFCTWLQSLWLVIIISCILSNIHNAKESDSFCTMLNLTIIGISIFEVLFEPRSRYLFVVAPLFIMLCATSLKKTRRYKYHQILI